MTSRDALALARGQLTAAVGACIFPGAVAEVGSSVGPIWSEAFGTLTFDQQSPPTTTDTLFDLASITKAVATTPLLMTLQADQRVTLDDTIASLFAEWRCADRAIVTVRDLLQHCSGLPARLADPPPLSPGEFERAICSLPLEYQPRSRSVYSDLDFILLGFLVADRGGSALERQFEALIVDAFGDHQSDGDYLGFGVPVHRLRHVAPTEPLPLDRRRRHRLVGEVHDSYAAALGGAAGHAGLFATTAGLGRFARGMLGGARGDRTLPPTFSPDRVTLMIERSGVPGSSRGLGWDTMLKTSSCGTAMSPRAFGHVGFTGTSLWVDPVRDRYFVLLTNRACGGGSSDEMQRVRRAFHDALASV